MASVRARRGRGETNFWPGYVDVLSTLLLAVSFLLSMFMLAQYFIGQEVNSKDSALNSLKRRIADLSSELQLEQGQKRSLQDQLSSLSATLANARDEQQRLSGIIDLGEGKNKDAQIRILGLTKDVDEQKKISSDALAQVELLNLQILALNKQLQAIKDLLATSEQKEKQSQAAIDDLGKRLNLALARKVQELESYRSDFFGRLRGLLANRPGIRVVGDRFVFDSEVLFPSGSADINVEGIAALDQVAQAIVDLEKKIPGDIPWVLRVDGHTDVRPIRSPQFASNWELSSARAIAVVKLLVARGVKAEHLAATGFGEFQPLDTGTAEEALRRNRRIELKLDSRS